MNSINTYDFFKAYCDRKFKTPERANAILSSLARPELISKEQELGKSFFEFSVEEMEDYLKNLTTNRVFKGAGKPISPSYMGQLITYYREILFSYMKETGVYFDNVLMDDRFNYSIAGKQNNDAPVFTKETLERCCVILDNNYDKCEADLTKMILWLCYSGCYDYRDVMSFKKEDINFDERTIKIGYRKIHMNDECYDLVLHHHDIKEYRNYRMTSIMVPYYDSFVWIPIRAKTADMENLNDIDLYNKYKEENNGRTFQRITDLINKKIVIIRKEQGIYLTLDMLYCRGIYDYMLERCGYDRAVEIIQSKGNRGNMDDYKEFISILQDYGARCQEKGEIYRTKYNIGTYFIREA